MIREIDREAVNHIESEDAGSLPSDTIQNLKNGGHCIAVTIRSGKLIFDPILRGDTGAGNNGGKALDPIDDKNDDKAEGQKVAPMEI